MTETLWTIEDVRIFLAVDSQTTAYKVAARHDAPGSVLVGRKARRWLPWQWKEWAEKQARGM